MQLAIHDIIEDSEIMNDILQVLPQGTIEGINRHKSVSDMEFEDSMIEGPHLPKIGQNHTTLLIDSQSIQNNRELYKQIFYYKKITKVLEKQLNDKNNDLFQLRICFVNYIFDTYKRFSEESVECLVADINRFIDVFLEIVQVYYSFDKLIKLFPNEQSKFLSTENLANFIGSLLFNHDKIYN